MMSRKIRNVGSVLLLEGLDMAQDFRIEIHQPEPEDIFLFLNGFLELQLFCEHPVPAGRIDKPARTHRLSSTSWVLHGYRVQPTATVDIDSYHGAVDQLHSVLQVTVAHLAIECESVNLEREYLRRRRNFVDDVPAIRRIVNIGLEIVGQAVLRIVLFHKVSAEPEFEHEIDTGLDKGFADDWAIVVRA